jgi:hypothetical protein
MSVRAYNGVATTVNDAYEAAGLPRVEWDADGAVYKGHVVPGGTDGSIYRGYELPDGRLTGSCFVASAARLAALAAERAAAEATVASRQNFIASIATLAQKVKDNTATAAEQRTLLVKLSRAVVGILSDL